MTTFDAGWWSELTAATLVGTSRREPPPLPPGVVPRPGADRETFALDGAALAGTLRRAGRRPATGERPLPAGPDARPAAPERATQLLHLILEQPPVDRALRPALLAAWLHAADRAGSRVPHHLLPALLDRASTEAFLRPAVAAVADARGAWLAALNPRWAWLAPRSEVPIEVDPAAWARSSTADRVVAVRRLRLTDPDGARRLLESTWAGDSAADRASLLAALEPGLGPADEDFLEAALDDRARTVRQLAGELLDGLPASARAHRMAGRLRPLLTPSGRLHRSLRIELPTQPDDSGVRDGLGPAGPGRSDRGFWLEQLAAGAPFEVWTDATGRDPDATVAMIEEPDVLAGLRRAARARRDERWARALLRATGDVDLLPLLPHEEAHEVALPLVTRARPGELTRLLEALPRPWPPATSAAVVERLRTIDHALPHLLPVLATGLHPDVRPQLERWARGKHAWHDLPDDLVQFLSLVPAITKAFS